MTDPRDAREWTIAGATARTLRQWTIAKYRVGDVWHYLLWDGGAPKGDFPNAEAAREAVARLEGRVSHPPTPEDRRQAQGAISTMRSVLGVWQ